MTTTITTLAGIPTNSSAWNEVNVQSGNGISATQGVLGNLGVPDTINWFATSSQNYPNVAAHEIGHVLGLPDYANGIYKLPNGQIVTAPLGTYPLSQRIGTVALPGHDTDIMGVPNGTVTFSDMRQVLNRGGIMIHAAPLRPTPVGPASQLNDLSGTPVNVGGLFNLFGMGNPSSNGNGGDQNSGPGGSTNDGGVSDDSHNNDGGGPPDSSGVDATFVHHSDPNKPVDDGSQPSGGNSDGNTGDSGGGGNGKYYDDNPDDPN